MYLNFFQMKDCNPEFSEKLFDSSKESEEDLFTHEQRTFAKRSHIKVSPFLLLTLL